MIDPEVLNILDSEWVQQKRDERGEETWGFELKPGAPKSAITAFDRFLEAQDFEDKLHGYK